MKLTNYKILTTILLIVIIQSVKAQTNNDWNTYLAYYETTDVAETNEKVFVLANGSLYSYGKEDKDIKLYSKQNGLNDTEISKIRYCSNTHTLVIIYDDGNIDLYNEDGITNLPFLKDASSIQDKTVNDIYFYNQYAYLSTAFGIMVINLEKNEIANTYKLSKQINSVCISGETIYASTEDGIIQGSTKDNLIDASNWKSFNLNNSEINTTKIKRICLFQNTLCVCVSEDGIYYMNSNGKAQRLIKQIYIKDMTVQSNKLLAYTSNNLLFFSSLSSNFDYIDAGIINDVSSLKEDGIYWVASGTNGLVGVQQGSKGFTTYVSEITINSPKRNYDAFMTVYNNKKLLITGGGRSLDRLYIPGTLMTYEDDKWNNFDESIANEAIYKLIGNSSFDYMGVAVDPDDENHYFVATYGEGVIELKDNKFVQLYNERNSTLKSAVSGDKTYVRIGSICFDDNKNLWMTNCLAQNVINVRKADGTWKSLYYSPINKADKIDKILITSKGQKWINVPESGIFVLDDNGTIDDTSDDKYNFFTSFLDGQSSTGNTLSASAYLSMAEDANGIIWLGTSNGIWKCSTPSRAIDNPTQLSCSRLIREDAYFLSGESVNAIAVDGANQKWIGTEGSGVFLINEDGSETIYNFTTDNSPLLSNKIQSIAINNSTGEVFFGTANGLVSFKSGVTGEGCKYSNVHAYPNPVHPDYEGKVTITGLISGSKVKITDINGNLIYQGTSTGTQFTWNCYNINGNKVATGVYLVLAATSDAAESVVTKIAVIK